MGSYTTYADYMAQCSKWGGYANHFTSYHAAREAAQRQIDSMRAQHESENNWTSKAQQSGYAYKDYPVHSQKGKTMHEMKIVEKLPHIRDVMLILLSHARPAPESELKDCCRGIVMQRARIAQNLLPQAAKDTNFQEIFLLDKDWEKRASYGDSYENYSIEVYFPKYKDLKLEGGSENENEGTLLFNGLEIMRSFENNGLSPRFEAKYISNMTKFKPASLDVLNLEDELVYEFKISAARAPTDKDKDLPRLRDLLAKATKGDHSVAYKSFEGHETADVIFTIQIATEPADSIKADIKGNIARAVLADNDKFQYCNEADLAYAWRVWERSKSQSQWLEFEREAKAWGAREQKLVDFLKDKETPITITPNNKVVKDDDFGAMSLDTCGGFIGVIMEKALTSGDTKTGSIHTFDKKLVFKYEVKPATTMGESPKAFVGRIKSDTSTNSEAFCTDQYLRTSYARYSNGESYMKKGSCKVSIKYASKSSWGKDQFDQYDKLKGKELVPVTYRDSLNPNMEGRH